MDEETIRTLLAEVTDIPAPPSRVDIDAARKAGRAQQWRNRTIGAGAAVAIAAAGMLTLPHIGSGFGTAAALAPLAGARHARTVARGAADRGKTSAGTGTSPSDDSPASAGPAAPAQFNPLDNPASFGWLPSSWDTALASMTVKPDFAVLDLGRGIALKVSTEGHHPNPTLYSSDGGPFQPTAQDRKLAPINGMPAYTDSVDNLIWEYAPGAWADLEGASYNFKHVMLSDREKIASTVAFSPTPFYAAFQIPDGLPQGWQVSQTDAIMRDGKQTLLDLDAGPAASPGALTISDDPRTGKDNLAWEDRGLAVSLTALIHSIKLLGTNPSNWTTSPLGTN